MTIVNNIRSCLHLTTCSGTISDVRRSALGKIVLTTVPSISKNIGVSGRCSRTSGRHVLSRASATWLSLGSVPGVIELLGTLLRVPLHLASLKHPAGLWRKTLPPDAAGRTARVPEALAPRALALSSALPWCSFPLFAGAVFRSSALSLALRRPECRHNGEGSASQAPAGSPAQCKRERRGRGRNSAGDARKRTPAKSGKEGQRCAKNCAGSRQK